MFNRVSHTIERPSYDYREYLSSLGKMRFQQMAWDAMNVFKPRVILEMQKHWECKQSTSVRHLAKLTKVVLFSKVVH